MIRLYLLQNPYNLSDMETRNEVTRSRAFSSFCRIYPREIKFRTEIHGDVSVLSRRRTICRGRSLPRC